MNLGFNKGNFVKFVRATPTLWRSLVSKDADTLYFIVDSTSGNGALYLGDCLIAGGLDIAQDTLSQLADVNLSSLANKDILMYNESTEQWENTSLVAAISETVKVMEGATAASDGSAGLVPQPVQGQQNLFLQGNGSWSNPTAAVELTLETLIGEDANMSMRAIAKQEASNAIGTVLDGAPESFDTLKEIADWIQTHPEMSDVTNLMTRVSSLEDTVNGNDTTTGLVSTVGELSISVSNINTILNGDGVDAGLVATVSNLKSVVSSNTDRIDTLEAGLRWQDLVEID